MVNLMKVIYLVDGSRSVLDRSMTSTLQPGIYWSESLGSGSPTSGAEGKPILFLIPKDTAGDNHRVMIYYPSSACGGMKELFRKVGNRSGEFHPDKRRVRREGYIYEEFMPTGGTDVKVVESKPFCGWDVGGS